MYAVPHGTRWHFSCPQMLYSWRVGGCLRGGALRLQQEWGSPGRLVDPELVSLTRSQMTLMLLVSGNHCLRASPSINCGLMELGDHPDR